MYCNNCGSELKEGATFCSQCGKKTGETDKKLKQKVNKASDLERTPETEKIKSATGSNKKKKLIIALVVTVVLMLLILVCGVIGSYFFFNSEMYQSKKNIKLATEYLNDNKYEQAVDSFEKVLEKYPENEEAYIGLIEVYESQEEYDQAIIISEEALNNLESQGIRMKLADLREEVLNRENAFMDMNTVELEDENVENTEEAVAEEVFEHVMGTKVGVAMPTKDFQRWNQDGENMKAELEAAGYEVALQYANNDIATQVSQVENMITAGCNVLVIGSIDGRALGTVLATAKENNIPVIAYDRLIMDSDAVSYYVTFDTYMLGTIQGQYIVDTLDLDNVEGPFNMELTTGSPDDKSARIFFGGAMDVLQSYIDEGKLVVVSGQVSFEEVATPNWSTEESQKRMENIITTNYADGTVLDVCMCSNDSTAIGVTNAIVSSYGLDNFPIITGQDCDITSVKNILAGKQSMSIFKDTRILVAQVVTMVDSILIGTEVEVNNTEIYDNNTGVIPSFLCVPIFVDVSNYEEILLDSGYYTADQLSD